MRRLPREPLNIVHALARALTAIPAEPNWPPTAPTVVDVSNASGEILARQQLVLQAEAALAAARRDVREAVAAGTDLLHQIDRATDVLFGPNDARKEAFGIPPKKLRSRRPPPDRIVVRTLDDGPLPGSVAIKWEPQRGSAYELQASTNPDFTAHPASTSAASPLASITSTRSKLVFTGLTAGVQYWFRVRAIRANQTGPWSDPATRTAGV